MRQIPLLFPFSLALFVALFGTAIIPHIKLLAFAPFLALLYNRKSFQTSLWIGSLCGLGLDLLSSEFRLGLHALNYCLTTLLLYKQKRHFFEDKPLALSLFTLLISVVSTVLQLVLISVFDRTLPLSGKLLITDLAIMPVVDALYAFLWFSCPIMFFLHVKKIGWRAFCTKVLRGVRFRGAENQESDT
ncbi:MAG: mreD [Verrucomicrobia bacterium]|nr:mreD [Verrucomicrobiota bacterium]